MRYGLRLVALAFVAWITAASMVACHTVKGVGRDVESVGEAGQESIHRATR